MMNNFKYKHPHTHTYIRIPKTGNSQSIRETFAKEEKVQIREVVTGVDHDTAKLIENNTDETMEDVKKRETDQRKNTHTLLAKIQHMNKCGKK